MTTTKADTAKELKGEVLRKIGAYRAMPLAGIARQITDRLNALDVGYPADLHADYLRWLEAKLRSELGILN